MLVLKFLVRDRVRVKVRARIRDSWGTKRLGAKKVRVRNILLLI